ncbi:MAG TPA: YiiD C-terminal domain-containing protein [Ktedonobacterales bacterium]|nr:YiiD C-terminal domain-containing protein [Ktedonobacterales bacterium]
MELDHLLAGEPYLVFMGMHVASIQAEAVALRLPLRQEVTNHLGMVHGGAQYALGEATAIALASQALGAQAGHINLLTASATISYRRRAQGGLIGRASLPPEEVSRLRAAFAEQGRVRFPVAVELSDETDMVVTTLNVDCVALTAE